MQANVIKPFIAPLQILMLLALVSCGSERAAQITGSDTNVSGGSADTESGEENSGNTINSQQPNILLVITDDQGLDSSAQYSLGNDVPNTPVINALAQNGITYDNVWATPSCTTTRASLLTGKHGVNNGVTSTPGNLAASVGSIQAYLGSQSASQDYATSVFGKWHVDGANPAADHPAQLGIDHYAGNLAGNLTDYFDWDMTVNGVSQRSTTYHTTALVDMASEWIADQDTPWFTWVAFAAPHSPFHVPPEGFNTRGLSGTAADIEQNTRDYYLSAIETLDTELGRLLDSMDAETRDNTVVIVIGDNGTPRPVLDTSALLDGHGKGTLFDGGVQVPLVISGAGVTRTNERESGLVSIVDFFATVASLAGNDVSAINDGFDLSPSFSNSNALEREHLYTEFVSTTALGNGWTVRNATHKYIAYQDGSEALYDLSSDPLESNNLLLSGGNSFDAIITELNVHGLQLRGEGGTQPIGQAVDITDSNLSNASPSCSDHVNQYIATATDAARGIEFNASLNVMVNGNECIFSSNDIPNHTFNDGAGAFPNDVSEQDDTYRVALNPVAAASPTALSLNYDNGVLLNGVKVDLLAAGCFGVGDGRIGCNDDSQPWRFDPMFAANGFRVDQHNAHSQPDGSYHYHGDPLALFDRSGTVVSPVIGFAADGFPIFGSYIRDGSSVRAAVSSYQLKVGNRPSDNGQPGGVYDGSYRDDYEFVAGSGDLDQCNGMTVNGSYGYYVTAGFPYVMACFTGTVDESFRK